MRRILIPLIFGLAGAAVLISLGVWQVQRLAWKEGILADIDARIAAAPGAVPDAPRIEDHRYLPVTVEGYVSQRMLRVLVSRKKVGAGYRLIAPILTRDHGALLIDLGFIRTDAALPILPNGPLTITGNLHWPDDRNGSTPANDLAANIWFARDLDQMAATLDTQPILIVAREMSYSIPGVTPLPVDTSGIPNDHLQYAITWFALALVWLIMTGFYLTRTTRDRKGATT